MTVEDSIYESAVKGRQDFREAYRRERRRANRLTSSIADLAQTLLECEEYFERGATAEYGPSGTPNLNEEMRLLNQVKEAQRAIAALSARRTVLGGSNAPPPVNAE